MIVKPMLATLGSMADFGDDDGDDGDDSDQAWAFEMKWDGIRAIAEVDDDRLVLRTRNGHDVTTSYPELDELRVSVASGTVLDGEIVALGAGGRPDFGLLQQRMGVTDRAEVEALTHRIPVVFMVFDLLVDRGSSAKAREYDERRDLLARAVHPSRHVQVPPAFDGDLTHAVDTSRALGLEGVVAKKRDSTYAEGRRSRAWIKIKHHRTQEVVVVGWRPGQGNRADRVGSLLLGIPDGDGLRYIGRVGSGFRERDLDDMLKRLAPMSRQRPTAAEVPAIDARDARWIAPTLVGEVEFTEWTDGGRLRHPVWRGWRPDKRPADVVNES